MGLNLEIGSEDRDKKIEDLVKYMKERKKYSYEHQLWAFKFYLCELLNFVNVIFQMCLTDKFLGYSFSEYGLDVLSWPDQDPELRMDPMSRVFPRITKCRFEKFGGSGTIQNFDALCVLGMNIINEKIFVFLWFWFIVLAIITGVNLGRHRHININTLKAAKNGFCLKTTIYQLSDCQMDLCRQYLNKLSPLMLGQFICRWRQLLKKSYL